MPVDETRIFTLYREAHNLRSRDPDRALTLLLEVAALLDENEELLTDRKLLTKDLFEAKAYREARNFGVKTLHLIEDSSGQHSEEALGFAQSLAQQFFDSGLFEDALNIDEPLLEYHQQCSVGNRPVIEKKKISIRHRMVRCLEKIGHYLHAVQFHQENADAWRRFRRHAKESSTYIYMVDDLRRTRSTPATQTAAEEFARQASALFLKNSYFSSKGIDEKITEGLAAESSDRFGDAVTAFKAARDELLKSEPGGETKEDALEMCVAWLEFCQRREEVGVAITDGDASPKEALPSSSRPHSDFIHGIHQPLVIQTVGNHSEMGGNVGTTDSQSQCTILESASTNSGQSTASTFGGVRIPREKIPSNKTSSIAQAARSAPTSIGSPKSKQAAANAEVDQSARRTQIGLMLAKSTRTTLAVRADTWFDDLVNRTHPLIYGPNGCYKESLTNGERYKRVRIAILDTGLAHPDGTEDVPQEVAENARQFVECQSYGALGLWSQDEDGHGTATATLALKVCPNAEICILKVLQKRGEGISREIVGKAIYHAVNHGANVISISLGWHYDDETSLEQAIEYAKTNNVLVFAATSNDGNRENLGVMYPARALNVISVDPATGGGTTSDFKPPSNDRNNTKGYRFTAPGEDVLAAYPPDLESSGETRVTGASFATPIAAGVAALILEFARQLPLGLEPGIFNHLRRIDIMRDVIYEFCSETSDKETIFRFIRPWKKFAATHHYSGPYGGDSLDTSSYRWQLANKIIDVLSERLGPSWRVGEKMHMEAQKLRIQNSGPLNDMVDVEMEAL